MRDWPLMDQLIDEGVPVNASSPGVSNKCCGVCFTVLLECIVALRVLSGVILLKLDIC